MGRNMFMFMFMFMAGIVTGDALLSFRGLVAAVISETVFLMPRQADEGNHLPGMVTGDYY